jgi:hypothetical protein
VKDAGVMAGFVITEGFAEQVGVALSITRQRHDEGAVDG